MERGRREASLVVVIEDCCIYDLIVVPHSLQSRPKWRKVVGRDPIKLIRRVTPHSQAETVWWDLRTRV